MVKRRTDIYGLCRATTDVVKEEEVFRAFKDIGYGFSPDLRELVNACRDEQTQGCTDIKKLDFIFANAEKISDKSKLSPEDARFLDEKFSTIRRAFAETRRNLDGTITQMCRPQNGTISAREFNDILDRALGFPG